MYDGLIHCVCCVPSGDLPGDERKRAASVRQIRVQKRAGFKRTHRSPQDAGGGGSLGVAQVALVVSIEGSRGSRICGGRAARRGHGEISWGNNRKANWFWQVWGAGSNAVLLKGRWGNIQQNYEIIRGTIQKRVRGRTLAKTWGLLMTLKGLQNSVSTCVRPAGGDSLKEELNNCGKVKVMLQLFKPIQF